MWIHASLKGRKYIVYIIVGICLGILIFGRNIEDNNQKWIKTVIPNLHNGDAKFFGNKIAVSVDGYLMILDLEGNVVGYYNGQNTHIIQANWIAPIENEFTLIYGNFYNEIGVVKFDNNYNLVSNEIVMRTEFLQIDPAVMKKENTYYMAAIRIDGVINRSNPSVENGKYSIYWYRSLDLKNWDFISIVAEERYNLKDIDIIDVEENFGIVYEKELLDKGNSYIVLKVSNDKEGTDWKKEEKVLLEADCDHEPAIVQVFKDKYLLYYSCDKDNLGESYMGSKMYVSVYNKEWVLLEKDREIGSNVKGGIILYDVMEQNGKQFFLLSENYFTDGNLVVEER